MAWMNYLYAYLTAQTEKEEGQGMVEYGLIIALVAIVVIVALAAVGTELDTIFGEITSGLQDR